MDSCYIYARDSVRVEVSGDTVRIDRYIYRYRDRFKTDTLIRGDTVRTCAYIDNRITTNPKKNYWLPIALLIAMAAVVLLWVKKSTQ